MMTEIRDRIHEANIEMHRIEAPNYQLRHPEIYSPREQKRIDSMLETVTHLITSNQYVALDFGAGTGNLTGRLLRMGYRVIAVDISPEMCTILETKYTSCVKSKRLIIINSPIEEANLAKNEFDLISSYSVLHHLPDYGETVRTLAGFLKKGGVFYIDHEHSPIYLESEPNILARFVKCFYNFFSYRILNVFYYRISGLTLQGVDYSLSDYWVHRTHFLDHNIIQKVFKDANFESAKRVDYHSTLTWILNPLFYAFRFFCNPNMSYWVAKK
jgi:ubiquinone/menaquinone biosynthesis C-methylase UbiE